MQTILLLMKQLLEDMINLKKKKNSDIVLLAVNTNKKMNMVELY